MAEKFLLRASGNLLDLARKAAEAEGITLSDFIRQGVELRLQQAGSPRPVTREEVLAEIAGVAAGLRAGYVLVPSAEALPLPGPGSWSGIMEGGGTE